MACAMPGMCAATAENQFILPMTNVNQPMDGHQLAVLAGTAVVGLLVLYVAVKITSFLIRVALVLAVMAGLFGLAWWLLSKH